MNVIKSLRNSSGTLPATSTSNSSGNSDEPRQGTTAWPGSSSSHPLRPPPNPLAGPLPGRYHPALRRQLPHQGRGRQRQTRGRTRRSRRILRPTLTRPRLDAVRGVRHHDLVARLEACPSSLRRRHQQQAHRPHPPRFGNLPLAQLDAHVVAAWRRDLTREGLSPRTIATYLSLLGTICNAAVDGGYLDHSPLTTPWPPPTPARGPRRTRGRAIPAAHDLAHPPTGPPARRRHRPPLPRPGDLGGPHRRPLDRVDHPALDRRPHELPFGRRRHQRTRPAAHPPTHPSRPGEGARQPRAVTTP